MPSHIENIDPAIQHKTSCSEFEARRKKREEACLEGLK